MWWSSEQALSRHTNGVPNVMTPRKYPAQVVWPWSGGRASFFTVLSASSCCGFRFGKRSGLRCIQFKMDDSFLTMSKRIKEQAVIWVLTHENKNPTGSHRRLLAFYRKDTVNVSTVCRWVIKLRDGGGNLKLKRSAVDWKACHRSSQFEQAKVRRIYSRQDRLRAYNATLRRVRESLLQ
jgi:hypothetical protein